MAGESSGGWRLPCAALLIAVVIGSTSSLGSENLLPRRVALHALAFALGLVAVGRRAAPQWSLGLLAAVVALAAAASPFASMTIPRVIDAWAALFIVWAICSRRAGREIWLRTLVFLAVLESGVGLLEQWVPLALNEASRPAGLLASRATAGVFVAGALPLLLGFRFGRSKWPQAIALVVSVTFLVSTASRAAWLGAGLASGFVLLRRKRVRWKALALAAGLIAGLVATPGPQLHWRTEAPYLDALKSAGPALQGRWLTWRVALTAMRARPLLGWGPGQFAAVAPRFTPVGAVRMEEPHNEWLRLGFEVGGLGIAAAAFAVHRLARRRFRNPVLWASLGALGLAACSGQTFLEPPTLVEAAVLGGLCFTAARGRSRSGLAGAAVCFVLLIPVALADAVQLSGSRQFLLARHAAADGRPRDALERAAGGDPFDPRLPLFAADVARQAGDDARCREWVERGLRQLPDSCELRQTAVGCHFAQEELPASGCAAVTVQSIDRLDESR